MSSFLCLGFWVFFFGNILLFPVLRAVGRGGRVAHSASWGGLWGGFAPTPMPLFFCLWSVRGGGWLFIDWGVFLVSEVSGSSQLTVLSVYDPGGQDTITGGMLARGEHG